MKSRLNWKAWILIPAVALAGCGQKGDSVEPPGQELRSDRQRITSPEIDPGDLERQVLANTALALDVYHQLAAGNQDNLFFSPHSIEVALAMTWAGARGETESAMAGALHFELDQAGLHPVFNHLDLELSTRGEGAQGADDGGFRLNVLNSLWGQTGFAFLEEFLDVLALHYGAGLRLLDFMADPDAAARAINAWVEEVTENRIQDLIPPGTLDPLTRLVLVNAIYFNAAWDFPFEEQNTRQETFTTASGETVTVPMMHQTSEFAWAEGEGYQAVELPYDGGQLAMLILVPDAGTLESFEQRLDAEFLTELLQSMQWGLVPLGMPRWELEGETISLKEVLTGLGMGIAFGPTADFSGMNDEVPLMIQDVLHQSFVKVDEKGTEAAAATAVILGETSVPDQGPEILLDRPFLYLIQDIPTGQVLFLGRVTDPR